MAELGEAWHCPASPCSGGCQALHVLLVPVPSAGCPLSACTCHAQQHLPAHQLWGQEVVHSDVKIILKYSYLI